MPTLNWIGMTLLIETKGDHLANAETADKLWLGNK